MQDILRNLVGLNYFLGQLQLKSCALVALMCLAQIAYQFYLYPCVHCSSQRSSRLTSILSLVISGKAICQEKLAISF